MTIKSTSRFGFQYIDDNEPYKNLPGVTEQVAKRLESAMSDAHIPPGNPDLNDILERIQTIGPPQIQTLQSAGFAVPGGGKAWGIGPLTNVPAQSSTTNLARPDGNDHVKVTKAGWYSLWVTSTASTRPGNYYIVSIVAPGISNVEGATPGQSWGTHAHLPNHWLEAGARIKFGCAIDTGARVTSTVKIQYHGNRKNSP